MSNEITSIATLTEYSDGDIVELPSFAPDKPFVAKMKRPSLLVLAKNGKIPNTLLTQANALFFGEVKKIDKDALASTYDIIEIMCEAAFVEPTYQQIKDCGIELTDQQYLAVFNYTQQGVEALAAFRKK